MLYCKKCNVSINGNKKCCPLCQGKLLGEPSVEAYPKVQLPRDRPCCCVATLIAIIVLSIVQKLDKSEYVTYLIVNCIYGIVPLIFILNDSLNIVYPSIICVGICSLVLAGILLFAWHDTTSEISKKMHL